MRETNPAAYGGDIWLGRGKNSCVFGASEKPMVPTAPHLAATFDGGIVSVRRYRRRVRPGTSDIYGGTAVPYYSTQPTQLYLPRVYSTIYLHP